MTIAKVLNELFSKGLEGYDRATNLVTNMGGVKLWWELNWKKQERIYIAEVLFKALKDLPVSIYLISRARLGENGRAIPLENGNGIQRDGVGLLLYTNFNMTDKAAKQFAAKIVQDVPMLEGYVAVGSDLLKDAPHLATVANHKTRDANRMEVSMRLEGCIFVMAPSGSENSGELWGYKSKSTTRATANARTIANTSEEQVDLTNIG